MKSIIKILIIFALVFINLSGQIAQTDEVKLNQVELMKQFIGTWKGDFGNGIKFFSDNKPFANGLICTSEITKDGETIESVVQLFGYDEKVDKFIIAELKESKPVIEICSIWFSTSTKGVIIITNPEDAPFNFVFEFVSSNKILQHAIQDGKIVNEIVLFREVDENL